MQGFPYKKKLKLVVEFVWLCTKNELLVIIFEIPCIMLQVLIMKLAFLFSKHNKSQNSFGNLFKTVK